MGDGTFRCQAAVVQPRQVVIMETLRGEAAGSKLLAQRFRSQREFLPRQLSRLTLALRAPPAQPSDGSPMPGTTGVGVRRNNEIDVPLNERALGSNSAQEVRQARGQGKPGRGGGPTSTEWREQAFDVGRQVQALVAYQHLQGIGKRADKRAEALDDGLLLVLPFEGQIDGRNFQHGAVAAPGGGAGRVEAEHVSARFP